jgi:hypothetical protein
MTLSAPASPPIPILDNVTFYIGAAGATPYMRVTGAAWNGHNFIGMGFSDVGGTKTRAIEITTGGTVNVNGYASGSGWLSGDGTDIETSGQIIWGPTAADGLTARVEQVARGTLLTWQAPVERMTAGYLVLRRASGAYGELLEEESASHAAGAPAERVGEGSWQKLAEVPVASFGGEPTGGEYRWLDESATGTPSHEYRIEELESDGAATAGVAAARTGPRPGEGRTKP